jgi:hypothetical protein
MSLKKRIVIQEKTEISPLNPFKGKFEKSKVTEGFKGKYNNEH